MTTSPRRTAPSHRPDVLALAARLGVPATSVRESAAGGGANHVWFLGDACVLRVPRGPDGAVDLRKENAVVPVARAAGVRTPVVLTSGVLPDGSPYQVQERVHGTDLDRGEHGGVRGWGDGVAAAAFRAAGRQFAALHSAVPHRPGLLPEVPVEDGGGDPWELLDTLRDAGEVDAEGAAWLGRWFRHLAPLRAPRPAPVLLHGDLAPQNLVLDAAGRLTAVLDWGDARWCEPAVEFAKVPPPLLPAALAGYREGGAGTSGLAARVLWFQLLWALGRLRGPRAAPGARHWTGPPASRLLGLLRFYATGAPDEWRALVPDT